VPYAALVAKDARQHGPRAAAAKAAADVIAALALARGSIRFRSAVL
jgi:hypothetical protein